jgi:hypothetical protein
MEEAPAALRFTLEVDRQQHVDRWQARERRLGRPKVGEDPGWAKLGRTAWWLGPARKISGKRKKINGPLGNFGPDWKWASFGGNKEKRKWAAQEMWAKIVMGCGKIPFQILNQGFEIK